MEAAEDVAALPFTLPADMVETLLTRPVPDGEVNRWRVRAGQSLQNGRRQVGSGREIPEDGHNGTPGSGMAADVRTTRGRSGDVSLCEPCACWC